MDRTTAQPEGFLPPVGQASDWSLPELDLGGLRTAAELLPLVYEKLRLLAAHRMALEAPGQTLQPTALVHEAWMRLDGPLQAFRSPAHFFAAAAEAMRRVLIDEARHRRAIRHGGGQQRVDLELSEVAAPTEGDDLLDLSEALEKLADQNQPEAELVKLRYFVGLTLEEAAEVMGISARTAGNYWAHARAWLFRELKASRPSEAQP